MSMETNVSASKTVYLQYGTWMHKRNVLACLKDPDFGISLYLNVFSCNIVSHAALEKPFF